MRDRYQIRIIVYGLIIFLTFALLTTRLYQLQIVRGDYFRLWADKNRFRLAPLEAPRGIIYDRRGDILVRNVPSFAVTVIPAYLPDDPAAEEAVFDRLAELLALPATREDALDITQELNLGGEEVAAMDIRSIQEMVDEVRQWSAYQPLVLKRSFRSKRHTLTCPACWSSPNLSASIPTAS
jgi:cell division protein FtsI/penicillin-binding protein 2